jgi:hypothetical protein
MPKSVAGVLHEWKGGTLHSGSPHGPVVTNQKQAIAIAMSEQRQMGHGAAVKHAMSEHAKGHAGGHLTSGK